MVLTGTDVVAAVALAGSLLLVTAGATHLRAPRDLAAVLAAQRLLAPRPRRLLAAVLGPGQLIIGMAALLTWVLDMATRAPFAAQAGLYAAFTGYLTVLLRRRPGAPCGCFGDDSPTGVPAIVRATIAALASGLAAGLSVGGGAGSSPAEPLGRLAALAAAAIIAAIAWLLPQLLAPKR